MGLKRHKMKDLKIQLVDKTESVKDMFLSKLHYYTPRLRVREELEAIILQYL